MCLFCFIYFIEQGKYLFTSSPGDVIQLWSIHNASPVNVFNYISIFYSQYYNTEKANVMEMKTDMNETRFGYLTDNSKIHVFDMGSSNSTNVFYF